MTGRGATSAGAADREPGTRGARRVKYSIMLAIACASGLALLGWTQGWYALVLVESAGHPGSLAVSGQVAAPAVSALALSGVALAGALSIAGPVLRVVFGVLESLLGASVILSVLLSELDPVTAGAPVVSQVTGITGTDSVHALVATSAGTLWPIMTLVAGVLMLAAGILVIATLRRWPDSSTRYQGLSLQADQPEIPHGEPTAESIPDPAGAPTSGGDQATGDHAGEDADADPTDPVSDWDDLTRGTDPTEGIDRPKRRGSSGHGTG